MNLKGGRWEQDYGKGGSIGTCAPVGETYMKEYEGDGRWKTYGLLLQFDGP